MAPTAIAAGVVEWGQSLEQALGLFSAQGIVLGRRLSAIGCPSRRHERSGEDLAGVADQRIQEDGFGLLVELIEIQAGASETFGHADFNPIGGTITGAFKASRIHIGFDQGDGVAVVLQPVGTEALEVEARQWEARLGERPLGLSSAKRALRASRWRPACR